MLVQLAQTPASAISPPATAIEFMLACHDRVRRFLDIAWRLATAEKAPPVEIADAAAGLDRFFAHAYALHVLDEDLSLWPRLKALKVPTDVAISMQVLEWEHEEIDPKIEELCSYFRELETAPDRLPQYQARMQGMVNEIRGRLLAHIELEEQVVFPWAKDALGKEALEAMDSEFKHRRRA